MLFYTGFEFIVTRKVIDRHVPATLDDETGPLVVRWQADSDGLRWIDDLCEGGAAQDLGGNGYPYWYTLHFRHLESIFRGDPPPKCKYRAGTDGAWVPLVPRRDLMADVAADLTDDEWFLVKVYDTS
jgi:hypothetical protein